ncbi:Transcription initiation factor TFIID subunit 13 [Sesbania bispinosa]|nr:Transcription initiation factor TFIID subunit 13 [Sesbania bispinosa]
MGVVISITDEGGYSTQSYSHSNGSIDSSGNRRTMLNLRVPEWFLAKNRASQEQRIDEREMVIFIGTLLSKIISTRITFP